MNEHQGLATLPRMDGREIAPGVFLIGEPSPMPGTHLMRCLADVGGALGLVELSIRFSPADEKTNP